MSESLIEKLAEISVRVFTIGRAMGDKDLVELSAELNSLSANIAQRDWHTGTPTEEDVKDIDEDNVYCFALCMFYDKWWLSDYLFKANMEEGCFEVQIVNEGTLKIPFDENYPWKKIEPYRG